MSTQRGEERSILIPNSDLNYFESRAKINKMYGEKSKSAQDASHLILAIEIAKVEGLTIEVLLWSMYALRNNPTISIEEAVSQGIDEWIK